VTADVALMLSSVMPPFFNSACAFNKSGRGKMSVG
jgi:hypothetical protein